MIRSCLFSSDKSVWDPKHIKELLCIPEDQLNQLHKIPVWSKDISNSQDTDKEESFVQNSQCFGLESQLSSAKSKENQGICLESSVSFNQHPQCQNLQVFELYRSKIKSVSLSDLPKAGQTLLDISSLKRTLSVPNFCRKFYSSKATFNTALPSNLDTNTKTMEVITQLDIDVSTHVKKGETNFEIIQEKHQEFDDKEIAINVDESSNKSESAEDKHSIQEESNSPVISSEKMEHSVQEEPNSPITSSEKIVEEEPNSPVASTDEKMKHSIQEEPNSLMASNDEKMEHSIQEEPNSLISNDEKMEHSIQEEPNSLMASNDEKMEHSIQEEPNSLISNDAKMEHSIQEELKSPIASSEKMEHSIQEEPKSCTTSSEKIEHSIQEQPNSLITSSEKMEHSIEEVPNSPITSSEKMEHSIEEGPNSPITSSEKMEVDPTCIKETVTNVGSSDENESLHVNAEKCNEAVELNAAVATSCDKAESDSPIAEPTESNVESFQDKNQQHLQVKEETKDTVEVNAVTPTLCDKIELDPNAKEVLTDNVSTNDKPNVYVNEEKSNEAAKLDISVSSSCDKMESDLSGVKQTVTENASINKCNLHLDFQNIDKKQEMSKQSIESSSNNIIPKEQSAEINIKKTNVPEANQGLCNIGVTEKPITNMPCQEFASSNVPNKTPVAKTVGKKRKLEIKSKISKKRKSQEKHGQVDTRNRIAGDIHYSVEEIETLLDIIKQFL